MTFDDLAGFGLPPGPAFALLYRPETDPGRVDLLTGAAETVASLADVPLTRDGTLIVVPYRQIRERGLEAVDDGTPLIAIRPAARVSLPLGEVMRRLPRTPDGSFAGECAFDLPDDDYAAVVRTVLEENIAQGDGSNFVLRRTRRGRLAGWSPRRALAVFRRLLAAERGAYWTFLVHWNGRTLLGATPESQVRVAAGTARMTPISGTYRYPAGGPTSDGLRGFLADPKENGELLMVVDEELKMMAGICSGGGRARDPSLRLMSRLAHTEYVIEGPTDLDVRDVLRLTMPAPTVTGSPVRNACRVVAGHEGTGRGYYGGVLALAGPDDLDAALLIRTADVDADGRFTIGAGATLVRGSDPAAEAMETRAKTSALLGALTGEGGENLSPGPVVRVPVPADDHLSAFWRRPAAAPPAPNGRRLMIVSAEDDFTGMLARMAESLGDDVRVVPWQHAAGTDADIVLIGPGPGDPRDRSDPRIDALHRLARDLLARRKPLLGVCLGHQVVAAQLGLEITRLSEPAQGVRRRITLDGRPRLVGLYHSFTAVSSADSMTSDLVDGPVQVTRDQVGGAVHALAARGLRSIQFHAESLLTEDGAAILDSMLAAVAKSTIDRLASKGLIRQGAQRHARC